MRRFALVQMLEQADCIALEVETAELAIAHLRRSPRISSVLIDEDVSSATDDRVLAAVVRQERQEMNILILRDRQHHMAGDDDCGAHFLQRPASVEQVLKEVKRLAGGPRRRANTALDRMVA